MAVTAREIMDEPDTVGTKDPVKQVKQDLAGAENTLIVEENGQLVGEIHENSLLKAFIPEERIDEESIIGILGLSYDESYNPDKAGDLMNKHEVTIPPDEEIGEIAFLMNEEDIRSIPVQENGEIIGVVHENSVVRHAEVE